MSFQLENLYSTQLDGNMIMNDEYRMFSKSTAVDYLSDLEILRKSSIRIAGKTPNSEPVNSRI